ncbi:precorrin-6A synthase (deacetylating) [Sphingobium sp. LB126]|uniref:precorrin-6A synthase (deacetylating) n=1 Tax=Sphingobium sp. LB126 TaxID=1983755 RepID=UPI000C204E11|nr:precorrin-6A synthase (deacetylating) [Sphingobium sp. LB126]PJG46166.1 precorrin-6A synthase (deacetylating) [Sphingobium sp. LB126]
MIRLNLIGIGTGNPDHLTRAAIKAMNKADLILLPRKGEAKSDLIDLRRAICAEVLTRPVKLVEFDMPGRADLPAYVDAVLDWHDAIAALWQEQITRHLPQGGTLALLVWGDPSLYDSSLRIAERLPGMQVRVIPGITSIQALTAAHGICLNDLAEPVLITTGRRLREKGWPECTDSLVIMLDGHCAFQTLPPEGIDIWWGAYLGMPQQALAHGPLAAVSAEIIDHRAALRREHGWIMDIYLLRRRD